MNILLIDDEPLACENMEKVLLSLNSDLQIVAKVYNTRAAEAVLNSNHIDVIFIDIDMPEENGLDFIQRIQPVNFEIVFVTAYNEFAMRAFKLNALDYIVKPLSVEYVSKALERVGQIVQLKKSNTQTIFETPTLRKTCEEKTIVLREANRVWEIKFETIIQLSADHGLTQFCFVNDKIIKKIQSAYGLKYYEEVLPEYFLRIHKSHIINKNYITKICQQEDGALVQLKSGQEIPISRRKQIELKKELNKFY